jgi:hypothetical protein
LTDTDPFAQAPDPVEEAPTDTQTTTGPADKPAASEPVDFHPYKVTLKAGSGYEAEWVTASYRTLEELEADFAGPRAGIFARVLPEVNKVASFFRRGGPVKGSNSGGGSTGNGKPAGATQAPAWMGSPTACPHGTRVYTSKMRKDNSGYWHAWTCPAEDRGCKAEFRNPPK